MDDAFDDDDVAACFVIPLRQDIVKSMGPIKTHDLMYESIRLVCNDKYKQSLEWYESGFFQVFTVIVAVVITIYNAPAGTAILSAAMASLVVQQIVIQVVLSYAISTLVEDITSEELAMLVAALATLYTGGFSTSSFVNASVNAASTAVELVYEELAEDIADEIEDYSDLLEDVYDEQSDTAYDQALVLNMIDSDSYNINAAHDYVKMFAYNTKGATLIRDYTSNFVSVMQYTDRPSSYIYLGNS